MIEIIFDPQELKLSIEGHAGAGKKGQDIVCSAVSILFYTLAQSIKDSREMLSAEPVIEIKDGKGAVSCKPKENFLATIQRTYWTVLTGFQMLGESYKEYVNFSLEG